MDDSPRGDRSLRRKQAKPRKTQGWSCPGHVFVACGIFFGFCYFWLCDDFLLKPIFRSVVPWRSWSAYIVQCSCVRPNRHWVLDGMDHHLAVPTVCTSLNPSYLLTTFSVDAVCNESMTVPSCHQEDSKSKWITMSYSGRPCKRLQAEERI